VSSRLLDWGDDEVVWFGLRAANHQVQFFGFNKDEAETTAHALRKIADQIEEKPWQDSSGLPVLPS